MRNKGDYSVGKLRQDKGSDKWRWKRDFEPAEGTTILFPLWSLALFISLEEKGSPGPFCVVSETKRVH